MNNLAKRTLTAILFVIVLLGAILLGKYTSSILFFILILLCQLEFYNFYKKDPTIQPQKMVGVIGGILLFLGLTLNRFNEIEIPLLLLIIPYVFLVFILELFRNHSHPLNNIGATVLGILYIAVPLSLLNEISYFDELAFSVDYNYELLIGYFLMLWANDTGAYFAGRSLGKHKLFERISPKKTWEGSIGGGVLAIAAAYLNYSLFSGLELWMWIGMSLIVVVFGSLGDLVESMFKRSINLKDSGNLLPRTWWCFRSLRWNIYLRTNGIYLFMAYF